MKRTLPATTALLALDSWAAGASASTSARPAPSRARVKPSTATRPSDEDDRETGRATICAIGEFGESGHSAAAEAVCGSTNKAAAAAATKSELRRAEERFVGVWICKARGLYLFVRRPYGFVQVGRAASACAGRSVAAEAIYMIAKSSRIQNLHAPKTSTTPSMMSSRSCSMIQATRAAKIRSNRPGRSSRPSSSVGARSSSPSRSSWWCWRFYMEWCRSCPVFRTACSTVRDDGDRTWLAVAFCMELLSYACLYLALSRRLHRQDSRDRMARQLPDLDGGSGGDAGCSALRAPAGSR